ncbi:universal stress protein [Kamptonema formosum]|uniref:universal stress protein n=1 Tax=Kamptonema formosum TaxID=331992 RepID=UPI000348205B|nr:universal stress protein [Oscillatoria sp. PCC 10802]
MSFKKILVALDDSELSKSVFTRSLEMALAQGSSLMLFHGLTYETLGEPMVAMPVELGLSPAAVDYTFQTQHRLVETQIQQAREMLGRYCHTATSQGVPAEFDCKIGEAGELLCQLAKSWGADLIVVGRRGRTGLAEALLGSVSNYVTHGAPCSVLVIQHPTAPEVSPISAGPAT